MAKQPPGLVIHIAPFGELRAYLVYEHELDVLAKGTASSLYLNFALALLSSFVTLVATLTSVDIPAGYLFQSFFSLCAVTLVVGIVLLAAWWKSYDSSSELVTQIKERMPPPGGSQE